MNGGDLNGDDTMMVTRRDFMIDAIALAGAAGTMRAVAGESGFDKDSYDTLRKQLRAYYPSDGQGTNQRCKEPALAEAYEKIKQALEAWAAGHPGYDALDVRRESYRLLAEQFVPVLFTECPFYFEAGVNGGWSGDRPARLVNALCNRFYREQGLIPDEAFELLHARINQHFALCCGPFSDDMHHLPPFHAVMTQGFAGLRADTAAALAKCPANDPHGRKFLETALAGFDAVHAIQLAFAKRAEEILKHPDLKPHERRNMELVAVAAKRCPWEPPQTFHEGLNTLWFLREILGYADGLNCFALGRPDAWFIGLYRADLAAGRLTEAEARDLAARFLLQADCHYDGMVPVAHYSDHELEIPLTLGGCDADGKPVYNELTEMFIDAHFELGLVFPKMHLRIAQNSPAAYLRKIGDQLMKGHAVFALFNDDRTVPQFEAFGLPTDRSRDYVCCGCWDGNVDTWSDVDTANYMSMTRILELMIHPDPAVEKAVKIRVDSFADAKSLTEARDIYYRNFMRFFHSVLSEYTRWGRQNAKIFPHPLYSACLEGCLAKRRDTTEGGTAFRPRVVTLAFLANVVDSFCAIEKLCFEDKVCTLPELLAVVRANWAGPRGEKLRTKAMEAPYWGDNTESSNGLMKWFIDSVSRDLEGYENDCGGPFVLATWIYREFNYWGKQTKATPDGRRNGDRLAQGFAPSEYRCKAGVTTVFNALGSLDHTRLYASNANLSFEKTSMTPELFEAVFRVACKKDMHLLQPNCFSVEELLDAQAHPERHRDLIVKVCGFSARFVALSKEWQDEVISRHRLK